MNEILQALRARKSARVFERRAVAAEDRHAILQAAMQAPTAGNQQLYTILDITEPAAKERLAVLCDNQPFIAQAPLVLVFLADCRRWLDAYRYAGVAARPPGFGDLAIAVADAVIAAQNAVVAAESLGLGSCYIGDICEQEEQVRELLALDRYVFPAAMLVIGHPTAQQRARKKPPRFAQEYLVQQNRYRRLPEQEHRRMLQQRGDLAGKSFEEYLRVFCARKYESGFSQEMSRSVARYLAHFRPEPQSEPRGKE